MIGLVDLGIGNLFSLKNLFYLIGKKKIIILDDPDYLSVHINEITHLIIPGVGSYPAAMEAIEKKKLEAKYNWL